MKKTLLLLTISSAIGFHAPAQTTMGSSVTTLGSAASPANLGLLGFNNSFGPFFTNQAPNGFTSFNQLLLSLQADLSQILPVVTSINDSFDFTSVGTNASFGGVGVPSTLPASSVSNLGTSLGQDLSVVTVTSGSTVLGGAGPAITPIAAGNASNTATTAASGTVATGLAFTSRRDVLRALIILQDDIERMLPLVNALNGGNATTLNSVFTNTLPSPALTPTGR